VPEDGHLPRIPLESDKVENEGVDDFIRQSVLFVEEHADEETVGACLQQNGSVPKGSRESR
jgi:hypothetical protein